ncbi:MAG TPA: hypothetical protein VJL88_00565 [Nitrospira sp.]|nr:hypothetical protein [Nitrospira sp.]
MKPNAHGTDLFTLIGMVATIAGILVCLVLLFTPVTFGAVDRSAVIDRSADLGIAMRWIQPILGQAIVEDAIIRQRSSERASNVTFDGAAKPAAGSVQWVMGRVIVELNRSRMGGGLPAEGDLRIVAIARHAAEQLQDGAVSAGRAHDRLPANTEMMF